MSSEASEPYPSRHSLEAVPALPAGPDEARALELIEADYRAKADARERYVFSHYGDYGAYSPEDITQSAYASGIAARHRLTDENVSPWLWEITINAATDQARKRSRSHPWAPDDINDHLAHNSAPEVADQPGRQIEADALYDTLREHVTNDEIYGTFEMYARDGMRQIDIADQLGKPIATIKKRIQMVRRTALRLIDDGILEF